MRALILAGGLGTRLREVISDVPKPMAPILNKPFLEILINYWIKQGVDEFYLSVGYKAQVIKDHFKDQYSGYPVHYIYEDEPKGTGGALVLALSQIQDHSKPLVVMNGDTFSEVNFKKMFKEHLDKKSKLTVALREVEKNDRYSGITLDKDNKIIQFSNRDLNSKNLLINSGLYIIEPKVFDSLDLSLDQNYSLEDQIFPMLIEQNQSIYGYQTDGKFIDIGVPVDFLKAQTHLTAELSL